VSLDKRNIEGYIFKLRYHGKEDQTRADSGEDHGPGPSGTHGIDYGYSGQV
jgi:hypothetical protein